MDIENEVLQDLQSGMNDIPKSRHHGKSLRRKTVMALLVAVTIVAASVGAVFAATATPTVTPGVADSGAGVKGSHGVIDAADVVEGVTAGTSTQVQADAITSAMKTQDAAAALASLVTAGTIFTPLEKAVRVRRLCSAI